MQTCIECGLQSNNSAHFTNEVEDMCTYCASEHEAIEPVIIELTIHLATEEERALLTPELDEFILTEELLMQV